MTKDFFLEAEDYEAFDQEIMDHAARNEPKTYQSLEDGIIGYPELQWISTTGCTCCGEAY